MNKPNPVDYLICPRTGQTLIYNSDQTQLQTPDGQQTYPIVNGIPRLFRHQTALTKWLAKNWGYKWETNTAILAYQKSVFWDYVRPLTAEFFEGKVVLEACCGAGIPDYVVASSGADLVMGFDVSPAVEIAQQHCAAFPNTFFVQTDLFDMPFAPASFDVVMCVAALHHLENPDAGFQLLKSRVKPDGALVIWVYGYEGTAFVRYIVDPIRNALNRFLPLPWLTRLSWLAAVLLWMLARIYKGLAGFSWLPLHDYMLFVYTWPFYKVHEMILDQLIAPITHYIKREQMETWFNPQEFTDIHITALNQMSWSGTGRLKTPTEVG